MCQSTVAISPHGIELEEGVEVHQLNTGNVVYRFLVDAPLEILLHHPHRVGVAVGQGVAQYRLVLAHANEVYPPGVDTDRGNIHMPLGNDFQTLYHLVIQGKDIPIEMSSRFDKHIIEARQLLQRTRVVRQTAKNGPPTSSAKVHSKEKSFFVHDFKVISTVYVNFVLVLSLKDKL